ncbi:hypothetical protein Egran_00010, partial [Elaphomyces granulatus]
MICVLPSKKTPES